eukprot:XP_015580364.1 uncharacterized protein LOC8265730 [Ricinus communis]
MYPKVKVRTEGQDDLYVAREHNWTSLLSLKDIQFLLLQDSCFPVKEYRDVSPVPIAKIPKTYVPNILLPTESASEGVDNKSSSDEEDRPNIRASLVPRPRAVISSPDNDALIANKNRVKATQPSALKNHNLIRSRHAQCKVVPSQAIDESPLNTSKSKDTTDKKIDVRGTKGSATVLSSQRRNITSAKPSSVRI